jgi:hypothetical protein
MKTAAIAILLATAIQSAAARGGPVEIGSPGLRPSRMDADGRLVEDWGTVGVRLSGEGLEDGPVSVASLKLDDVIPAARAASPRGPVTVSWTAYRAPAYPAGVDVLAISLEETKNRPVELTLALDVPEGVEVGTRTARLGNRTVLVLPDEVLKEQPLREWGYADEALSLAGWGKPDVECDPAFRNIRAGMGGVPIVYRFAVKRKSAATVVLGFCESHWAEPAQRPLSCHVEGADPETVDPVATWGRHKPGVLSFAAKDQNGDGLLEVVVRSAPGASDRNPILSAVWLFPQGETPKPEQVISGSLDTVAIRYVDAGGDADQSIYPPGKLEYQIRLPAGGKKELVFAVACPGGSAPSPETTAWTPAALRRAASDVWRDWPKTEVER